jgi:hypothetical protein
MTYHGEVNALVILEGIEQSDEPLTLCIGQDITLRKNVSYLIQFEQQLFAHDLQGANFSSILLLRKEDLSVSALSNLSQDLEVSLAETNTTLPEVRPLPPDIFLPDGCVYFFGCSRRCRVFGFEVVEAVLAGTDIRQQIKVVVEEVCKSSAKSLSHSASNLHS